MKTIGLLTMAYKELLKIDNNSVRIELQPTYCTLRGLISKFTGKDIQEVQEHWEQVAIKEKYKL